jgi:hypothetical protein
MQIYNHVIYAGQTLITTAHCEIRAKKEKEVKRGKTKKIEQKLERGDRDGKEREERRSWGEKEREEGRIERKRE